MGIDRSPGWWWIRDLMQAAAFGRVFSLVVLLVLLLVGPGRAQINPNRITSLPVIAEYAAWQFNGEPILVGGGVYYPTRETRIFDGQIMTQIDVYQRVPV